MQYALCLLGLLALVAADKGTNHHQTDVADDVLLTKQKSLLQLLWRVNQPVVIPEILNVAQNFDIQANVDKYTNVEAVKRFVTYYKRGFLPKNEIFSVLYDQQRQEAVSLFDIFYYAKDFDTFYKTAAWARVNMNPGQFVYALSVAVLHREDTKYLVLPAPYEIYPHLFVDSYVIQEALDKRMTVPVSDTKQTIVIPVNKTGMYPYYQYADGVEKHMGYQRNTYGYESLYHSTPEDRVAYFTEDIALNSYYNYFHLYNPFWMNGSSYKFNWDRRGEYFYYIHQQLLARYVLERYSNDLEDVEVLNYDTPIEVGYNPMMRYPNGQDFPIRVDYVDVHKINAYEMQLIQDFERRIHDAIDLGFVVSQFGEKFALTEAKGIDILGHMIESTANSVHYNYYGRLYQLSLQVLGHIVDPQHVQQSAPGVLEHFETVLRDPLYYRLLSSMVRLFLRHKSLLPRYLREEFMFPGVKVESVDVEKLITYFDTFDFDISAAVKVSKKEEDMIIMARQYRMNHKPFTYTVNVQSEKPADVVVRTFIGPKYDAEGRILSINERRRLMVEVDRFPEKLSAGKTTFTRRSSDFFSYVEDAMPMRDLYKKVDDALNGKGQSSYDKFDHQCGFPHRLLLPKGKRGGMPFVFFVAITPATHANEEFKVDPEMFGCRTNLGLYHQDQRALGWPFDRVIDETQFHVSNFFEKDVIIFHKRAEDINNQSI